MLTVSGTATLDLRPLEPALRFPFVMIRQVNQMISSVWQSALDYFSFVVFMFTYTIHQLYDRYYRLKLLVQEVVGFGRVMLGVELAQMKVAEVNCQTAISSDLANRLKDGEWSMNNNQAERQFVSENLRQTKNTIKDLGEKYEENRMHVQQSKPLVWLALQRVLSAAAAAGLLRSAPPTPLQAELEAADEKADGQHTKVQRDGSTVYFASPPPAGAKSSQTAISDKKSPSTRTAQSRGKKSTVMSQYMTTM
ncbi:hypothetical protein M3Y95_00878200 [Aphelenchoides besseyi]|nr:hypothetical protein M3Y95_00878200 [Aphelenchoides besseyi]